jgi:hypothetical protein
LAKVEGLFTVLMCVDCQAARGYGPGPYPAMTRAEMRERLAAGEEVARMYQEPGLARLERQAEAAQDLLGERRAADPS